MDKLNEVISQIRSCLISTKGQVTIRQLEDDFYTLLGCRIPYRDFGFKTLEEFLQSIPTHVTLTHHNGQTMVDAQISEKSAHISSMVRKQKTKKPKTASYRYRRTHFNQPQKPPPNQMVVANRWRPRNTPIKQKPNNSNNRLTLVSHNQFVNKNVGSSKVVQSKPETVQNDVAPLNSTKKRITKLMKDINLDRDSGNSSPTTEYSTTNQFKSYGQAFVKSGDAICDLKNFILLHKLPEAEVKIAEQRNKKHVVYHCKIAVGQHSYLSYPDEFFNPGDAERKASERALEDLMSKHGNNRKSLLISSNDDIIERIPPMLEKHNNAVWKWQIEEDYIDRFNEQLPSDWLQVIDRSISVSIENCLGGCVLKYCHPGDDLQKGKRIDINSLNVMDVSVPCNTVDFRDGNLYALVTAANSTDEIWCQQFGTAESQNFHKMLEEMEKYYEKNKEKHIPPMINLNSCYAAFHDGAWVRVRTLLTNPKNQQIDCFLIDYGEEVNISPKNIYLLLRQFAFISAQAFVCRLKGLEGLTEASIDSEHLNALIGREFLIEMITDDSSSSSNSSNNDEVTIPVVMYDCLNNQSVNEYLISKLTMDSATPILDRNLVTNVYISNIEPNGDVYVQVRSTGFNRLMEMLNGLNKVYSNQIPNKDLRAELKKTKLNDLYLCKLNSLWERCKIIDWSPDGNYAQIYFVDYGNTSIINTKNEFMIRLDKVDDVISKYPEQAVKVRINIQQIPGDFVERATKLMPKDQLILLKIVNFDNENVAWVEFFKRSAEGGLFCINKSIDIESELQTLDCVNNNDNKTKKRLMNLVQFNDKNVPSGGSLKKPNIPKKDQYFNVKVPFAVNPWNFFVQPLESLDELNKLMQEMQLQYKNSNNFSPLHIEDIAPGQIYASKHEDGLWYRTSVLKVINSGSISVFYCDFGYYTNLTINQLVPLDAKYMDLPYQALKAKIIGIKPVKNKWTVDDCEFFKNLVTNKRFASIMASIERDELYRSDIVLQLVLIDSTQNGKDIFIKDILVENGIASADV